MDKDVSKTFLRRNHAGPLCIKPDVAAMSEERRRIKDVAKRSAEQHRSHVYTTLKEIDFLYLVLAMKYSERFNCFC